VTADVDGDGFGDGVLQETFDDQTGEFGYFFFQGTSMATPHVAAAAAILYSAGIEDPVLIKQALVQTADDVGTQGFDTAHGHGLINPLAALEAALGDELTPIDPGDDDDELAGGGNGGGNNGGGNNGGDPPAPDEGGEEVAADGGETPSGGCGG